MWLDVYRGAFSVCRCRCFLKGSEARRSWQTFCWDVILWYLWYCWWFRNPGKNHLLSMKACETLGYSPNLNWFFDRRILEPSTVLYEQHMMWNLETKTGKQRLVWKVRLMEEILHHMGWLKPYESWDNHHPWWCMILSINSIACWIWVSKSGWSTGGFKQIHPPSLTIRTWKTMVERESIPFLGSMVMIIRKLGHQFGYLFFSYSTVTSYLLYS